MKKAAIQLLKDFQLRVTPQRLCILEVLLPNPSKAFSSHDFLSTLGNKMNRSTIYRTLETLIEKKVIYKLKGPNGNSIYSIQAGKKCNHQTHPHLKCVKCGIVECLPSLPEQYVNELTFLGVGEMNIMLNGVCRKCSENKTS